MLKKLLISLCLTLTTLSFTQAETTQQLVDTLRKDHKVRTLRFVAPEWEGQTQKDGTGLYWEVIKAVYEPLGFKVRTNNVSWSLAMQLVEERTRFTAIVGEYSDSEHDLIFPNNALDVEYLYVAYPKSAQVEWKGRENLKNKKVAWVKDYELMSKKNIDFTLVEFTQVKRGIEKLKAGEINFFVDEENVLTENIKANGYSVDDFEIKQIPPGTDLFVGFANRPDTKLLRKLFDQRMSTLWKEGKLGEIYRKWEFGIPPSTLASLRSDEGSTMVAEQ